MPAQKKKLSRHSITVCLLSLIIVITPAHGVKKIVVPNDFPSIHTALGEAEEGDTIYVLNGTYHENVALVENIVLIGESQLKTVISGHQNEPCIVGADGAAVINFTIKNGKTGILCKNTRTTIKRNIIIDNKGAGIHALIALPEIENNIIYRNEWTGIFLESSHSTRTSINHNVIVENGYCGIFCANRTEVLIRNNILAGNKQYGIFVEPDAKRSRIIFNNFFANRIPFNGDAIVDQSNTGKDPLFIKPRYPVFNFFVRDVSGCKGRGENNADIGLITEKMIQVLAVDHDADGLMDEIDQCPDVAEDKDGFEDEDGCPDYDNDNDGIPDLKDQCPNEPEDIDGFQDEDGCADLDNDRDGIPDSEDKCPNQPETVNGYKDDDGCPDEKPVEIRQAMILQGVNFKTASAELLEESYYVLEKVFNSLEAFPNIRVEISGHTDDQGGADYNMLLSYDRAKTVLNYLVMRGIDPSRLIARGYGKSRPIADNGTEEGRAKNRRVELIPLP